MLGRKQPHPGNSSNNYLIWTDRLRQIKTKKSIFLIKNCTNQDQISRRN